jgi:hypothetical protein
VISEENEDSDYLIEEIKGGEESVDKDSSNGEEFLERT